MEYLVEVADLKGVMMFDFNELKGYGMLLRVIE